MTKLKLYKAIKLKNQLVGELKTIANLINNENTIVVGNTRNYDINELIEKYEDKMNCLIKVKTAIHKANNEIYHKICQLSEYKLLATHYKRLSCSNGPNTNYKNYREQEIVEFDSQIQVLDRDSMIKALETKISNLQDELDEYNYNTDIEIVAVCK